MLRPIRRRQSQLIRRILESLTPRCDAPRTGLIRCPSIAIASGETWEKSPLSRVKSDPPHGWIALFAAAYSLLVIPLSPIDPAEFAKVLQPMLEGQDVQGLTDVLKSRWSHEQIANLFLSECSDVRKMAALAFSLVGRKCCLAKLIPLLQDSDPFVNQMAEHAMWAVWFRCGPPEANHALCHGSKAMNRRDYDAAIEAFTHAIEIDPSFAEAYNQRAIAKYLLERYDESIADCMNAVEHMPCHFGAWAGMGHCHVHVGRPSTALDAYEPPLKINPHLDGVRQAVDALREAPTNHA